MSKVIEKQNLKSNFIFQFSYQALILIIPLILSPYLTRHLGDTALGTYTYVNSIAYYFVLFANLGISRHGQRIIAQSRNDIVVLRKTFWSLYVLHALISLVITIGYVVFFTLFYESSDKYIYLISSLYVLSALFDVTWLFYGLENFKSVVANNAIIKVVECIAIFCFVHTSNDLWKYTFIMSLGFLLGQAVMLPKAIITVKPISFSWADVKVHIKPLCVFSVTVISATMYTVFDKTLLGLMTTKENVAYYEYANRIVSLPRTFTTIIGTVMFPRVCNLVSKGDVEGQRKYLNLSLILVYFVGFASLFGLAAVSKLFSLVYYGDSFVVSGDLMIAMCALPLIIGLGDIIRTQYLIPNHRDKEYMICIIANAVVNLILSCLLIPFIGVYGVVVGTCAAELLGVIVQLFVCRKMVNIAQIFKKMIPFATIGLIMYVSIRIVAYFYDNDVIALLLQIGIGALVYSVLTLVYMLLFGRKKGVDITTIFSKRRK